MNGSVKIQPSHLDRQAVVYLRQSSTKQVLHHCESAANQRALRERLLELGWTKGQISVIDEDQGLSAKHSSSREGFQKLAADVGLGKVGVILGYEVSRLSRNCADWHRLLELCALFDTLIGDADGIYHPRDFNDRLLLGLKGTMSEAELHSLRLRLDAGRLSKAKRGELVHHVPTGLVRTQEGQVIFEPDTGVRERIALVFSKFPELGTIQKVLTYFVRHKLQLPRRQTSGLYAGQALWKEPSAAALRSVLQNPAYAGAFAYGRRQADPMRQTPGRPATGRLRRPRSQWIALVKDVYPAYITWEQFEQIQKTIEENRQRMEETFARKRAVRQGAALLTGLTRCGLCGHAMRVAYKENRFQYTCNAARTNYGKPSCQFLSGRVIDQTVTEEFFRVLRPAEIDALEQVSLKRAEHHQELIHHLEQEVARLDYEAKRAERQYHCVDPENRLIAATLERNWEAALHAVENAKSKLSEAREATPSPLSIPKRLRQAFANAGRRLPEVWSRLSVEARKSLLRTLIEGVNLLRRPDGTVQIRIVWRGGLVSERIVRLPVFTLRDTELEAKLVKRIRQLTEEGMDNDGIAESLNREKFVPCRSASFTDKIVAKLKMRHGVISNLEKIRRGEVSWAYTLPEMARLIGIDPSWIYREIGRGTIKIDRDSRYGCYMFPKTRQIVERMKQLKNRKVRHASIPKVHHDG
jgi:DNA invertase Pin-like site-specific DNA recombinase